MVGWTMSDIVLEKRELGVLRNRGMDGVKFVDDLCIERSKERRGGRGGFKAE